MTEQIFRELFERVTRNASYEDINSLFRQIVSRAVCCDSRLPIPDLPPTDFRAKLMDGGGMLDQINKFVQKLGKEYRSIEELINDVEVRNMFTIDIIRSSFKAELAKACPVDPAHWIDRRNAIVRRSMDDGIVFDRDEWVKFLIAVDEERKRLLEEEAKDKEEIERLVMAKTEEYMKANHIVLAGAPKKKKSRVYTELDYERLKIDFRRAITKDWMAKKKQPKKDTRELYIHSAAVSAIRDPDGIVSIMTTACYNMIMAIGKIDGSKFMKLEHDIMNLVSIDQAALIMDTEEFKNFTKHFLEVSERLIASLETIVVHHEEGDDTNQIDQAVRRFIRENPEGYSNGLPRWKA